MEYQVKKPSHATVPLNRKMDVLEDAYDFPCFLCFGYTPLLSCQRRKTTRYRQDGAVKETQRRKIAVTSSLNPHGSSGKQGGREGGALLRPPTLFCCRLLAGYTVRKVLANSLPSRDVIYLFFYTNQTRTKLFRAAKKGDRDVC